MKKWLARGWDMTVKHRYIGIFIFLYRLLWGFFLFRIVDAVVTPVLARFPDLHPSADAIPLFLIEAEFRLLRTDLLDNLLWLLAVLLLLRMLISPVINAGLYYSFHHSEGHGTQVLPGIKRSWKPVFLLYWSEQALILLPALWLWPMAKERFFSTGSTGQWLQDLLPYAAVWLLWGYLLHLLFQCMQFGAVSREGIGKGFLRAIEKALPLLAVSLALAGVSLAASAAVSVVSLVWSGFAAVVLHQAFHFIRSLLSLWTAASQYAVWRESGS